jgi:hypothetical protein
VPASVTNVVAIAAGGDSSMALRSNGTVVVWGGYNSGITTNVPANVSNVVGIACGAMHSVALKRDGTVVAWGDHRYGQTNIPSGLSNVVSVAAGAWFSLALKADGKVVAWGDGFSGQTNVPAGLSNVIAVAAGGYISLALRSDGTVTAWGQQQFDDPGLSNVVALSAGSGTLALKADGSITNWGYSQTHPVLTNVIAIARGGASWVAVIGDGSPALTVQPATQTATRGSTVVLHARAVGVQPMSYQWQLNGANLPDAINASLAITNFQGRDTGVYQLIAANVLGTAVSAAAWVTIPFSTNLPAALNATNLVWTTGLTNTAWFAQIRETHDGDSAAQSGPITHNQQSSLQAIVKGPGIVSFWWKVSSEEGFDFLKCFLDGNSTPLAGISGQTEWALQSFFIPAGSHILKWTYAKDGSVSDGQDAGWVDEVVITPDPQGLSYTINNGTAMVSGYAGLGSAVNIPSTIIGLPVTGIGINAFRGNAILTSVTIGDSVTNIGIDAFYSCMSLTGVYFKGDAPSVDSLAYFGGNKTTVYYLPGTSGWTNTFGGRPPALWKPLIETGNDSFGVRTNQFGFTISWASGMAVAVDACTNLANPVWLLLQTNTLTSDKLYFSDPKWTNYSARFYRVRWP